MSILSPLSALTHPPVISMMPASNAMLFKSWLAPGAKRMSLAASPILLTIGQLAGFTVLESQLQPPSTSPAARSAAQRAATSEALMRAVAHWAALGLLAAAEPHGLRFLRLELHRRQARPLVRTVAERLALATPAGAPEIALARFDIDLKGRLLGNYRLFHDALPSLRCLCYCPDRRTVVNGPSPHKACPMAQTPLHILLAAPRGFCAGVDRAIQIVEQALARYGAPVYVRHEIVHNRFVVEQLETKGAVFVEELDQVPDGAPVVFSAHGVPKAVPAEAQRRNLLALDATCPLVSKVHREAERHAALGRHILLIGHADHPEVVGTMGQLPPGAVSLVQSVEEALTVSVADPEKLAYITQTTLSADDMAEIVGAL